MLPELVLSEVNDLASFARERNLRILLTTSRRTPVEVEDELTKLSSRESDVFRFCVWGRSDEYNPVPAFLELADSVMVTEDSVSMASEAILTGHHPLILPLKPIGGSHKLERFHRYLYEHDLAFPLRSREDNRALWASTLALSRRDHQAVYNAIGLPELLRQARELLGLEVVSRHGHTTGT
jgi:mitochondrial fission protein ELM1